MSRHEASPPDPLDIAIIGLAARLPGAADSQQFWRNLCSATESISILSDDQLLRAGLPPSLLALPNYVKAAPLLDDVDLFDARFFAYTPREAATLDPQHRLFLEVAFTALEAAGYGARRYRPVCGVYAGAALNTYLLYSGLLPRLRDDYLLTLTGSDKDFLATRVSYKLDLTGPSLTVQTAC